MQKVKDVDIHDIALHKGRGRVSCDQVTFTFMTYMVNGTTVIEFCFFNRKEKKKKENMDNL